MVITYSEEQLNLYSRLAKLTEEIKNGKEEAFTEMYESMLPHVSAMVISRGVPADDVADIVSDAMIKVYKGIGTIKEPQATYKWIMKVASNFVSDYIKKSEYREVFMGDIAENENTSEEEIYRKSHKAGAFTLVVPEDILVNKERQKILFRIVEELKPDLKQILMMHCFEEKTFKEIANETGLSENSVKTKFYRTLNKLETSILNVEKKEGIRLHSIGVVPIILSLYMYVSSTGAVPAGVAAKAALAVGEARKLSIVKPTVAGVKTAAGGATATGTTTATATGVASKAAATLSGKAIAAIFAGVVGVGTVTGAGVAAAAHFYNEQTEEVAEIEDDEEDEEVVVEETQSEENEEMEVEHLGYSKCDPSGLEAYRRYYAYNLQSVELNEETGCIDFVFGEIDIKSEIYIDMETFYAMEIGSPYEYQGEEYYCKKVGETCKLLPEGFDNEFDMNLKQYLMFCEDSKDTIDDLELIPLRVCENTGNGSVKEIVKQEEMVSINKISVSLDTEICVNKDYYHGTERGSLTFRDLVEKEPQESEKLFERLKDDGGFGFLTDKDGFPYTVWETKGGQPINGGLELTDSEDVNGNSNKKLADGIYSSNCSGDEQKTGPSKYSACQATFKKASIVDGYLVFEGRLQYNGEEVFEYATYSVPVSENCTFEWDPYSANGGPDDEIERFNYWFDENKDGIGLGICLNIVDGELTFVYYGVE